MIILIIALIIFAVVVYAVVTSPKNAKKDQKGGVSNDNTIEKPKENN